jgi:hypothetical protein
MKERRGRSQEKKLITYNKAAVLLIGGGVGLSAAATYADMPFQQREQLQYLSFGLIAAGIVMLGGKGIYIGGVVMRDELRRSKIKKSSKERVHTNGKVRHPQRLQRTRRHN